METDAAQDRATKAGATPPAKPSGPDTLSGKELRNAAGSAPEQPDAEERTEVGAVEHAAAASPELLRKDVEAQQKAMKWFLSSEPSAGEVETKILKVNIGTDDKVDHIDWVIKAVPMDVMRRIRKQAQNTREAKKTGVVDEYRINLSVVAAGTVAPDISEATRQVSAAGGPGDPVEVLRIRFQRKPGYVAQISGEIMGLSGFDDEDVQESTAIEAAGN